MGRTADAADRQKRRPPCELNGHRESPCFAEHPPRPPTPSRRTRLAIQRRTDRRPMTSARQWTLTAPPQDRFLDAGGTPTLTVTVSNRFTTSSSPAPRAEIDEMRLWLNGAASSSLAVTNACRLRARLATKQSSHEAITTSGRGSSSRADALVRERPCRWTRDSDARCGPWRTRWTDGGGASRGVDGQRRFPVDGRLAKWPRASTFEAPTNRPRPHC